MCVSVGIDANSRARDIIVGIVRAGSVLLCYDVICIKPFEKNCGEQSRRYLIPVVDLYEVFEVFEFFDGIGLVGHRQEIGIADESLWAHINED